MTTLTQDFTGNGEFDLEQQLWAWRSQTRRLLRWRGSPLSILSL
jgi:hypothetical protein